MQTPNPLASIIIPAHNSENFIARAINSALAQDYRPIEIIVVDDGSIDKTADIVQIFGPPVRYFHQVNAGPSAARNRGIQEAMGEFILFLDSDDEYLPGRVRKGIEPMLLNEQVGITHTRCILQYADGNTELGGERFMRLCRYIEPLLLHPFFQSTPGVSCRRTALESVGTFDEQLASREDHDLWMRIREEWEYAHIPEPLVRVHIRQESYSSEMHVEQHEKDFECILNQAIKRRPDIYHVRERQIRSYARWLSGMNHLLAGHNSEARSRFIEAFKYRPHYRILWPFVISFLPKFFIRSIRRLWRRS
ncbi:glycosyltransferase family 2 protein [Candidatus Sumerlaeota bacterium]|nr:glycosyltransferase family 2 protein [Candidatus Sumerlaeota bacterium]